MSSTRARWPPPSRGSTLLAIALITVAGSVVYANSLDGVFVFDDNDAIKDNPNIRTLWPVTTPMTTGATTSVTGRPIVGLTLAGPNSGSTPVSISDW